MMTLVEVTLHLPEQLANQAMQLGILTDAYIAELLRAEIAPQLAMAQDSAIQREIVVLDETFRHTEWDGLDTP